MYLTNVTIDIITEDRKLRTISIYPAKSTERIIIEHVENLKSIKKKSGFGSVSVLNVSDCNIHDIYINPSSLIFNGNDLTFSIEHIGIPIGYPSNYPRGIYNLILPPNFKLQDIHVVDPYDKDKDDIDKKPFNFEIVWDKKQNRQIVRLFLISCRYDTFSLKVFGNASLVKQINPALKTIFKSNVIAEIADSALDMSFGKKAKNVIMLINKYLELKPNIAGIGLNFNSMIDNINKE